jgi:hypothetical protein
MFARDVIIPSPRHNFKVFLLSHLASPRWPGELFALCYICLPLTSGSLPTPRHWKSVSQLRTSCKHRGFFRLLTSDEHTPRAGHHTLSLYHPPSITSLGQDTKAAAIQCASLALVDRSINFRALQGKCPKPGKQRGDSMIKINRIAHKEELGTIPNCPLSSA